MRKRGKSRPDTGHLHNPGGRGVAHAAVVHGTGRHVIRASAGLAIKQARLRAGMKQYALGLAIGFTNERSAQKGVHDIECSRCDRMDRVMAAADVLGVPLEQVIEFVPLGEPEPERSCG
jgi:hypothetical protein